MSSVLKSVDSQIRDNLVKRVGPQIWELVSKHPMPLELLGSNDARVRFAVVAHALMQASVTRELADKCELLACTDSDADVRGVSLTCVSSFYRKQNNPRISALLATVVCNEDECTDVRWVAYSGLSLIPNEVDLSHSPLAARYSFPAGIDWKWVKTFLGKLNGGEAGDETRGTDETWWK